MSTLSVQNITGQFVVVPAYDPSLNTLIDVSVLGAAVNQVLTWKGTYWEPADVSAATGASLAYIDGSLVTKYDKTGGLISGDVSINGRVDFYGDVSITAQNLTVGKITLTESTIKVGGNILTIPYQINIGTNSYTISASGNTLIYYGYSGHVFKTYNGATVGNRLTMNDKGVTNFWNNEITNIGNPTDASSATNKWYVDASLNVKTNLNTSFNTKSTDYVLTANDNGKVIEADASATITFPDSVDTGFQVTVVNTGVTYITLNASTLLTTDSSVQLRNQYAGASAVHKGSGTWYAFGNLKG